MDRETGLLLLGLFFVIVSIPTALCIYQVVVGIEGAEKAALIGITGLYSLALCFVIVAKAGQ